MGGGHKEVKEVQVRSGPRQPLQEEIDELYKQDAEWVHEPSEYDRRSSSEKPFMIEPFQDDRERLPFKMSDEDRHRRQAWVDSQALSDREPVYLPSLYNVIYNPIRRFLRIPGNAMVSMLAPVIGEQQATVGRRWAQKFFIGYLLGCGFWYYAKYNPRDWEQKRGVFISAPKEFLPGEEYPKWEKSKDFNMGRKFHERTVYLNR